MAELLYKVTIAALSFSSVIEVEIPAGAVLLWFPEAFENQEKMQDRPFPFTGLSGSKKRPAFVVADLQGEDIIVCQITSKNKYDSFSLPLTAHDFNSGGLPVDSFIRPNKIFTADKNNILSTAGHLCDEKIRDILNAVITIISS